MESFDVEGRNQRQEALVGSRNNQPGFINNLKEKLDVYSPTAVSWSVICGYLATILLMICVISLMSAWTTDDHLEAPIIDAACQGIYNNLAPLPFTDITLASTCPEEYEELELGQWPGTDGFCYISNTTKRADQKGNCEDYFESIPAQHYTKWKGTSICVKRASKIINDTDSCPSNYTTCNSHMCVYGSVCPITHLEFSATPFEQNETIGSANTSFGVYLNFKRDPQSTPIGLLQVSIGKDSPCLSVNEYSSQVDHATIKVKGSGCPIYGAFPGYQRLDEDTAENMFSAQPFSAEVLRLPLFRKILQNQNAYLTYVPRLELKDESDCRSLDLEALVYGSTNLYTSSVQTRIIIFDMSLLLIYMVLFVVIFYVQWKRQEAETEAGKTRMIFFLICCGLAGIVITLGMVLISSKTSEARSVVDKIHDMVVKECFVQPGARKAVNDLYSINDSIPGIQTAWVVTTCLGWIWLAIGLVVFYLKFM